MPTLFSSFRHPCVIACLWLVKFRKLFSLRRLAHFRDFPWEIPLAHCVRGGMVRTAVWDQGGEDGRRRESAVAWTFTIAAHLLPLFPCMRCTIPPVTIGTGGISSVQRQISSNSLRHTCETYNQTNDFLGCQVLWLFSDCYMEWLDSGVMEDMLKCYSSTNSTLSLNFVCLCWK